VDAALGPLTRDARPSATTQNLETIQWKAAK
jgi:hypothetical protein